MIPDLENVFVSVSGGLTSAYMALWIRDNYKGKKNLIFVFANTGQEHEETYIFLDKLKRVFGLNIVWIEAIIPPTGRKGYKVVNSDTACRDGSIFDDMCVRFGIPTMGYVHCTRELKTEAMLKYVRSLWKGGTFSTAIGIRADEIDRVNSKYKEHNFWYPLAFDDVKESGVTKEDVNEFWEKQPFTLGIPNFLGNCVWCWKKSYKKHMKIIDVDPDYYKVPHKLEALYSENRIESQKRFGQIQPFFRGNKFAADLLEEHRLDRMQSLIEEDQVDGYDNSCKESCEPDFTGADLL